jgi:hypothetical protein
LVYLVTSVYGIYSIWTDLKGYGAVKEDLIMGLLVFLWIVLAYGLWAVTERFT